MLTIHLTAFAALEGEQVDSAYWDDYVFPHKPSIIHVSVKTNG